MIIRTHTSGTRSCTGTGTDTGIGIGIGISAVPVFGQHLACQMVDPESQAQEIKAAQQTCPANAMSATGTTNTANQAHRANRQKTASPGTSLLPLLWQTLLLLTLAGRPVMAENLYQAGTFRPLTADNKAFRTGDVVTVQILENSTASSSADTGTRRNNNLAARLSAPSLSTARQAGLEIQGDFDGGGRTQRSNRLLATITVTVKEVLPDGDLRLAGEQRLTVNEEPQRVALEGRVRPQDISEANVVLSTRLADARITYVGEGDIAERNRRSWWRKLFDWGGL